MGENSAAWRVEWPRVVFGVKIHYIICPYLFHNHWLAWFALAGETLWVGESATIGSQVTLFHNHWLAWCALAGETLWVGESATIGSQVTNELVGSNTTYVMLLYLGCIRKPSGIYSV